MQIIDKYFKDLVEDVTFIELKEGTNVEIGDYKIPEDIPLPISTKVLLASIKDGEVLHEGVNLENIIDGIIYLMGVDKDFKHILDYIDILNAYSDNVEDLILYKGLKYLEAGEFDLAGIFFRALIYIDAENVQGLFNYALCLENIFNRFIDLDKKDEAESVINYATQILEKILDVDDKYFLAYYKLGYYYLYFNQYLKAKLMWEKYLVMDEDSLRLQEVRNQLEEIEDNVLLESGITFLSYDKFDQALDMFLKLLPRHDEWWELYFLLGQTYNGLGDYNKALEFYKAALELNKEEFDIYNEMGILLFNQERIGEAVDIFTQAIEYIGDDYKLYFNRGLGYLQLGKIEEGYEDIKRADELHPNDANISAQRELLEEVLEK